MNYANAAFNASDNALYIASHCNDDDYGDDRKRREEEIEEEYPSASLPLCQLFVY